jgi:hypothetical protein
VVKRERWTEQDLDALPSGEHDYFERKSGALFQDNQQLLGALAKAVSAFANSGGGHLLLGLRDDGTPDGVPPTRGSIATRDWLEQKVPHVVNYQLSDFRVHVVERSTPSRIPPGREVIVIDVGDSALAPHQCDHAGDDARRHVYYHRRAGRSEPAPHFYLELLRRRLVSPVLEAEPRACAAWRGGRQPDGSVFVGSRMRFVVRNVGRVAAHQWAVQVLDISGHPPGRADDYRFNVVDFPPHVARPGDVRMSPGVILPGGAEEAESHWGVCLRLPEGADAIPAEVDRMILAVTLGYRVATENSLGEVCYVAMRPLVSTPDNYVASVRQWLG